jgi:hypothetical protein
MFVLRYILDLIQSWHLTTKKSKKKKKPDPTIPPQIRIPFGLYAGWITMAASVVASSQFLYGFVPQLPLSLGRTVFVLVGGASLALWIFMRYRNRAQLAITLVALAGIANNMGMY